MAGNNTISNPYSWNTHASLIVVDQPAGVGYSWTSLSEAVGTTIEASHDFSAFLHLWKKAFPKFNKNPFHITGSSYAVKFFSIEI